ncbi:hypothetical protein FBY03_11551 [Pseudomonas sp. SJZ079]|nr:hypothetical protein FBY03_11551 [Pseudomonas sp. SJZ079]
MILDVHVNSRLVAKLYRKRGEYALKYLAALRYSPVFRTWP